MRKCAIKDLDKLFKCISESKTLYIPVDGSNKTVNFKKYADGMVMSDALKTDRSAKDFFFPQTENLMDFKVEGKSIEIIDSRKESDEFVIFGVRACDCRSFEILDKVFLSEPVDSYYADRRQKGIIVGMACARPSENCFCQTFGIDATAPSSDVVCYKTDSDIYFEAKTEKGNVFMDLIKDVTTECGREEVDKQIASTKEILAKLPLADLKADAFGKGKTEEFFDAPEWKELSEACLACGTCTFVCPTCQCYDIKDFDTGNGIKRFRCWDSCMYSEFTKCAHGNPRTNQLQRFRQRFMHKLVYFPTNNDGVFGCVGCGRCVAKCPISMNIVKVMKKLGGKENE